ncbi:MAG: S-adenosylmethionine--tRNA ribosyltransferase-isomerase [Candidatus Angelobacter sp.]|nr:S-adenosylmethionine--tRNA ribosyltransferase-isomerase [Candidatus Angelobacter sp.]
MLHLERKSGEFSDRAFRDLPSLLRGDDLLVFNNTRVFPARLFGKRSGSHAQPVSPKNPAAREFLQGQVEVLLTKELGNGEWEALVRPGRKIGVGERLFFGEAHDLEAEVIARSEFGERTLRFQSRNSDFFANLDRLGEVPLPPYVGRAVAPEDCERYQTVFAKDRGSAAAPTAGLHFTPQILEEIRKRGIETAEITLHVGLGTFQPVRHERVEDNKLHAERYEVSADAAEKINCAKAAGRRIVAVGTTTVRTLEFVASQSAGKVTAGSGEAEIFIYPGFQFQVIDALLTNFHLPESTLLMLVCAFAGREKVLRAYEHAVKEGYRFFSYGDCMFVD